MERARLGCVADRPRIERAVASAQPVVLIFEEGSLERPVVIALVEDAVPEAPLVGKLHAERDERQQLVIDADADGRRVRIQAHDEIVFQCGESSVTLKSNGRVLIRGIYVETHAASTNRIKGGHVRIN